MFERRMLSLCFFFVAAWICGQSLAQITFIKGEVQIIRKAKNIHSIEVNEGFELQNYDTIITGPKSQLEISLSPHTGLQGSLQVPALTAFCLELSSIKNEQISGLELLKGSLFINVHSLTDKNTLQVRTEALMAATQKAQFHVVSSVLGDWLVTTRQGRVECRSKDRHFFSEPGRAVELWQTENHFRSFPVDKENLIFFENKWQTDRLKVLKTHALAVLRFFARRYKENFPLAAQAYTRLHREAANVIDLWKQQDETHVLSPADQLTQQKNILAALLLQVRLQFFSLERFYYRIQELRQYKDLVEAEAGLSKEYTVQDFFQQFEKDEATILSWMGEMRHLLRLYDLRYQGSCNFWNKGYVKESALFH